MNSYLIPANSKKSMLWFSMFTTFDLLFFGISAGISLLLFMILPTEKLLFAIIALAPGLISGFLVVPIPNYHNVMTFIKIAFTFYTTRQHFVWKGWCFNYGEEQTSKK